MPVTKSSQMSVFLSNKEVPNVSYQQKTRNKSKPYTLTTFDPENRVCRPVGAEKRLKNKLNFFPHPFFIFFKKNRQTNTGGDLGGGQMTFALCGIMGYYFFKFCLFILIWVLHWKKNCFSKYRRIFLMQLVTRTGNSLFSHVLRITRK